MQTDLRNPYVLSTAVLADYVFGLVDVEKLFALLIYDLGHAQKLCIKWNCKNTRFSKFFCKQCMLKCNTWHSIMRAGFSRVKLDAAIWWQS